MKIGKQQQYIQIILQIITKIQYIKLKSYIKNQIIIFFDFRENFIFIYFIYSNKNKENLSVVSKIDLSTINNQEKNPWNKNQQKYSFNKNKSNINTTQREQLSQNNFQYPNNKYIIKENYSNQSPKKQINQLNQRFKSPEPKQRIKKVDDYKYQPLSTNSEICQICGKPKRPRGIYCNAKSNKSIKREIIAEETSTNSYVIRYSTENENQNKPYFQTFRAPGTRFCPVHGYV